MAKADGAREDSFLSQVEIVSREIEIHFQRVHELLQKREAELLAELERLAYEYLGDRTIQQMSELSISKEALRDSLRANENKAIFEESAALIDARIKELETKLQTTKDTYGSVSLEWEVELEQKLSVAGEIRLIAKNEMPRDYRKIESPITVFGEHDNNKDSSLGVFRFPNHMAIHPETDDIYICDAGNNRVQVFNQSFEFTSQFSKGMNWPVGMCIGINGIYVTQYGSHCLNVYSTEGTFIKSVGRKGQIPLEFDGPRGLDVSYDKARIYVAECFNDRIQCLNLDLKFISFIDDITGAVDVKLTPNEVVLLSSGSPCVSLYSYSHQLIREMIPRGEGNPIGDAAALILDKSLNILITDYLMHCFCVFSFDGALIHRFGNKGEKGGEFIHPTGIAIDNEEKIIVVNRNPEHCLQVF